MWTRVVRKCAAPSALAMRRFATEASSGAANSSAASIAAKVGRDIPLVAVPREARRHARLAARRTGAGAAQATSVRTTSLPTKISLGLLVGSVSGSIVWHFVLDESLKKLIGDTLGATPLGDLYQLLAKKIEELAKPYTDPYKDKLLPDWPIPAVPPGTPPVPVLVLDLEDTLVHSEWSRKHGWRHAKRPGVDEFLEALAHYYEIVVFSNNHLFMAEEIVMKMDRKQAVLHVLGREASRYHNSAHVKDLSKLNRDLRQIVLIDDDPAAFQLQPENAIPIRPYTDGRDREDNQLKELVPFLKALAMENVGDFRSVLAEFRDEDGVIRDLPTKYASRVRQLEIQKEQEKQKGLGGFIRRGRMVARPSTPGQM